MQFTAGQQAAIDARNDSVLVSAAAGSIAGIAWLDGADDERIAQAVSNTLANVSGILCDGAKPSCAAKIAAALDAALMTAFHGAGFGAASVGGEATFRSHIAGPIMTGTEHVAPWDGYRCPYGHATLEASGEACANMIDYVLGREGDDG